MTKATSREDFIGKLNEVKDAVHDLHPDNTARLEQFDAHLSTVAMCVEHLFDESARSKEG
jgi:predicted alpha/beta-hydrolase family hydrolase